MHLSTPYCLLIDCILATITGLKEAATKDKADATAAAKAAADKAAADKAEVVAARDKALADLATMTTQDQKHAAAVVSALDWTALDKEYADLQTKLTANSAKYDAARATLATLAESINEPFVARAAALKAARAAELKAQLDALEG